MTLPVDARARARSFDALAASLREEILRRFEESHVTLDTNSSLVERRGAPMVEMLLCRLGRTNLQGLRVVDLGCGYGALSVYFAFGGARVVGIDHNGSRLDVGRAVADRHKLPARFEHRRMESLALPDGALDAALLNNSFCYLVSREARRAALRETARVLRPGGVVILREPNRWNPIDRFTRLPLIQLLPPGAADRASRLLGRKRSRVRLVSPPSMRRELRAAGFTDIVLHSPPGSDRPRVLELVARYWHSSAVRP